MINKRSDKAATGAPQIDNDGWAFAFEGSGIGLWDWNVAANTVVFSDGWKDLFGYAQDEIGDNFNEWSSLLHPEDRATAMADIQRYAQGEIPVSTSEHRIRCKDGSYKWVLERGKIVSRTKDGYPLRVLGIHTDITERKHLERRLAIQHEVADVLVMASGLSAAISAMLQPVCETLGWDEGLLWVVDESAQRLRCHSMWTASGTASERYGDASRELTFLRGVGLPGRVWADAKPAWISDVTRDENFPRAALAEQAGFHTAAAFPVRLADRVYAVLEFFHHEIRPADSSLLTTFQAVADQLSQFCARERAEERLRQTYFAMDQAVDAIYWVDPQAKILYANEAASLMVGYSREELLGMTVHHLNPNFPASMWPGFWEETRQNKTMSLETSHRAKDGRLIPIDIRVSFLAYEGQEFHCAFVRDITERKRAEGALEQIMHRYKDLIDSINGIVWEADASTTQFTFISRQVEDILGYPVEQWLSSPTFWVDHIHPEDQTWAPQYCIEEVRKHRGHTFEYRMLAADGRTIWIRDLVSVLVENGRVTKLRGIMSDVTDRKLSERALAQAAQDLGRKNRELAEARDKALEAVKIKAEFLATMSHEIRTPMNGVIGMTGLLLDTPLTSEQREYAETVRLSGEHLLDIINEILDFSKIETGKLDLEVLNFDLHATMEEAVGLLGEQAYDKGLELTCLVQAGMPTALRGDPGRLRQILVNLIGNAVKFTEQGEVVVTVSMENEPDGMAAASASSPYRTLRFEVSDTGVGIAQEQQAKLFQPFTQADGSSTRKYGGAGLGLAICKQLVEMMGGRIGLDSKVGEGSVFWLTIRFSLQSEGVQPVATIPAALRGRRILIVDDHATNRRVLEQSLRGQGVMYQSAENGYQALECLRDAADRQAPFALAILDMQMPGMDGLELARRIKSEPAISATRLVLLTSVGQRGDAKAAQSAGIAAYLTKPIRQSLLYECLGLVLGSVPHAVAPTPQTGTTIITRYSLSEVQTRSRPLVLLVEDNPVNQKVAANMIEKLGYRVNVAANGREAVDSLASIPYALVFMDCQMPEMDGFEATRVIRKQEESLRPEGGKPPHLPIVAMTANAMQEDRDRCLAVGMDDFLSKPVTSKSLAAVLDRWLPHDQVSIEAESKAA
ncbi:MAG: hypothetical protein NTAFB01_04440 [Nitrospira sp.]